MRRAAALAAFATLLAGPVNGQAPRAAEALDRAMTTFVAADSIVGAATVIVGDGRIVAHREYGMADRAVDQRVDERSIFHWASITKTLTGIAIMQLRDRGLLTLDDTVVHWIPELRQVHDPYGSIEAVTIRMLMSHTAGFQAPTWPYGNGEPWEPFEPTRWEQLVAMMPYQTLRFAPGSRYGYSNPGFVYLGRIIEHITGDPWATYVQKNILTPLGLYASYVGATPYHLEADRSNNYTLLRDSTGHERTVANGRDFDPGITIPNSGWNAPLTDLARYAVFLTGTATRDSTRRRDEGVLSRATLREMWTPVARLMPDGDGSAGIGLAFFIYRESGATVIGHPGEQAGFRSFLYLNPATGVAVIGAVNTTNDADPRASARRWDALTAQARHIVAAAEAR